MMEYARYRCPMGYQFEVGTYPDFNATCSAAKNWEPKKLPNCIRELSEPVCKWRDLACIVFQCAPAMGPRLCLSRELI